MKGPVGAVDVGSLNSKEKVKTVIKGDKSSLGNSKGRSDC